MTVVSDTTPLNYLILISQIDLLPRLYGQVIVPTTIAIELQHLREPAAVRTWIESPPAWPEIRNFDVAEAKVTGGIPQAFFRRSEDESISVDPEGGSHDGGRGCTGNICSAGLERVVEISAQEHSRRCPSDKLSAECPNRFDFASTHP